MEDYFFISYSNDDGKSFADKLANDLLRISPSIPVWLDKRELKAGDDWDDQIVEALRDCAGVLYVMTQDSVQSKSECKREWTRALRYKKLILPLLFDAEAEMPYRLEPRQYIDFAQGYEAALATLRNRVQWSTSPEGILHGLQERLADAERDLVRSKTDKDTARIQKDKALLKQTIAAQEEVIAQPAKVRQKTRDRIKNALEQERQPFEPIQPTRNNKFKVLNPPPAAAPSWFQDRHVATNLLADFIKNDSLRLMTVVGRGGIGKTAMVCRLLKALEHGQLPDDLGPLAVDGIVYLSPKALRQVNLAHLYADLCKLLPPESATDVEEAYRNPQASVYAKMQSLLNAFTQSKVVVLLDNFETVTIPETGKLHDAELEEALRALLELPNHSVKVIITTRVMARSLQLVRPGYQTLLRLDEGLESPHAENILREMDADSSLGLRDASPELLDNARKRTLGYPRALEALVAILSVDRSSTLAELLADAEQLLPENVVEALVGEAFSSLDMASQRVMQALAILGTPVPAGAVDYLLQPYNPEINSEPLLRALVNRSFVRSEAGQFHLHEVDRKHALQRIPEEVSVSWETDLLPFTRRSLLRRAADYYQTIRTPRENWKTIDDLAPQLAEIEVRIASEEYDVAASVLLDIGFSHLLRWGHARLVKELHERLKEHLTDAQVKESSFNSLGLCYRRLGAYRQAIDCHEQSMEIARKIDNPTGEGSSLGNLGLCYSSLGNYHRAINCHEQSMEIAHEMGDRAGEGTSLGNLGLCYSRLGDYRRAIDFHEQSMEIAREMGDRPREGNSLGNLGNCYSSLGDYRRAIDFHEQSMAIVREMGDRAGEGNLLNNLGTCYISLGDYRQAIELHEKHLEIAREIGDRSGEGCSLINLGEIYNDRQESAQALEHYQAAIKLADDTENLQIQHEARFGLAVAYLYQGDLITARETIDAIRKYDYPENNAAAWAITGIIRLRLGEPCPAKVAFSQGLSEADTLLKKFDKNLSALGAKALALCGLALCDNPAAHLTTAKQTFQATRQITTAKGIVTRLLHRFDALAIADTENILAPLRKVAAGE